MSAAPRKTAKTDKTGKAGRSRPATRKAAAAVPETPTGDDRVLRFADSLASGAAATGEVHEWETWLTVRVDEEQVALPVRQVQEVLRVGAITRVPHAPFPVCGVTNLRGAVLAVVDLRVRLGFPARPQEERSRIVVVSSKGRRIGLLVESAEQVVAVDALRIEPPPEDVLSDRSYYVQGVYRREEELLILLDLDRVLEVRAVDDRARADDAESDADKGEKE